MIEIESLELKLNFDFEIAHHNEKSRIDKFILLLKMFDLKEITELISEEYSTEHNLNKYHILAGLKAVLDEFISEGDTALSFKRGTCSENCYEGKNQLYELKGNNSGHAFVFGIIEENGEIVDFHACWNFIDKSGASSANDGKMNATYRCKIAAIMRETDLLREIDKKNNDE